MVYETALQAAFGLQE